MKATYETTLLIQLSKEMKVSLRKAATERDLTVSEFVRTAIREKMEERPDRLAKIEQRLDELTKREAGK